MSKATRRRGSGFALRHRNLTLGLLWFLQNDPAVPAAHRRLAQEMHLPKDEFTDNGHFPFQLYVREARRLVGEYTLTEHDITGDGAGPDASASCRLHRVGEFPIDSFPCRKRQPGGYDRAGRLSRHARPHHASVRDSVPHHDSREAGRRDRSGGGLDHPRRFLVDPHGADLDGARPGGGHRGAPGDRAQRSAAQSADHPTPGRCCANRGRCSSTQTAAASPRPAAEVRILHFAFCIQYFAFGPANSRSTENPASAANVAA